MCFYCRIVHGDIRLDPETYRLVAPLAQAVHTATNIVPDATDDKGFETLRALAVKHNGESVLPFIDAYIAFHETIRRRSSAAAKQEGEHAAIRLGVLYAESYVDVENVSVDEREPLRKMDEDVTEIARTIARLDSPRLQSLFGRMRSPKAAQVVGIIFEARARIVALFAPSR